jgi:hypothetical protein
MFLTSSNDTSNSEMGSSRNNPIKKIHRVSDKSLMVIDEGLVVKLEINNDNSWVEQRQHAENEILLVIKKL